MKFQYGFHRGVTRCWNTQKGFNFLLVEDVCSGQGCRAGDPACMQEAESKIRMLGTIWNLLDFMAFFPPLMEMALLYGAKLPFSLGRFDLRWFKILRFSPGHCVSCLLGPRCRVLALVSVTPRCDLAGSTIH